MERIVLLCFCLNMGELGMKKFLMSLILLVPLVTGCANVETEITINDDKSAEVVSTLNYDSNLLNKNDAVAASILKNYETFIDSLYKVETSASEDSSFIKVSKKIKNLATNDLNLASLGFVSNLDKGRFIELKKNFVISSYNIDMTYDYQKQVGNFKKNSLVPDVKVEATGLQPEYYQKYGDMSELEPKTVGEDSFSDNLDEDTKRFVEKSVNDEDAQKSENKSNDIDAVVKIVVPGFASYNNADSVLGNVYVWEIKQDEPTEIKLQYVRYSGLAITLILIFGASLLVILAKRILKHETQKRMDNIENIV